MTKAVFVMKTRATLARRDRILSLLAKQAMSSQEIADSVHAHQRTINTYLAFMHSEANGKVVYIASWRHLAHAGPRIPLYRAGNAPDAPEPPLVTKRETNQRYWRNVIANNAEMHDRLKAKKRMRAIKPHRDPMIAAMFGPR